MLDIDALKGSKNQSEDIKKALETVKESDAYLFGSNEPFMNAVGATGGGADGGSGARAENREGGRGEALIDAVSATIRPHDPHARAAGSRCRELLRGCLG